MRTLADTLVEHAEAIQETDCDLEDLLHYNVLKELCNRELDRLEDSQIEAALAELKNEEGPAYEALLAVAEECAQTKSDTNIVHKLLLIPIMAWSRYEIVFGAVNNEPLRKIAELYRDTFSKEIRSVHIANLLFSPNDLPEKLCDVRKLLITLTESETTVVDTVNFLGTDHTPEFSDVRYIALAVAENNTLPQEPFNRIEHARKHMRFSMGVKKLIQTTLRGSIFTVNCVSGFFRAWRSSEAAMRVYSLQALISFVRTMGYGPSEQILTLAYFDRAVQSQSEPNIEIRIAVSTRENPDRVIAGIVWPVNDEECESQLTLATDILTNQNIRRIRTLDTRFTMEWCEECGAPMYANPKGEIVHIEAAENNYDYAPTLN